MRNSDWQLLRREYGDIAYEHPEHHAAMLALIKRPLLVVDNLKRRGLPAELPLQKRMR